MARGNRSGPVPLYATVQSGFSSKAQPINQLSARSRWR